MLLSKRNTQILIVLAVMILALTIDLWIGNRPTELLRISQAMQVTATVGILFGILKAHPSHKPTFYKLWLGITSVFFTCLICLLLDCVSRNYFRYYWGEITGLLLAAAGVVYMMSMVYKEFVELTQGILDSVEVKQPPPYVPILQNMDISVKS